MRVLGVSLGHLGLVVSLLLPASCFQKFSQSGTLLDVGFAVYLHVPQSERDDFEALDIPCHIPQSYQRLEVWGFFVFYSGL